MDDSGQLDRQLCDAVWKHDIERALEMLEKGASVNARDELRWTVLMRACLNKNKAMVDLLLKRGAAVNMTTNIAEQTALMLAVLIGDEEMLDLLMEHGADVMMKDNRGWTVVHCAAARNRKTILDHLLLMGARGTHWQLTVDIEDNNGHTPLWLAAFHDRVDCVDVLLVHGANPEHKSKGNGSPLDIAKKDGHETIVSMMTEALTLRSHPYVSVMISDVSKLRENIKIKEMKAQSVQDEMKTALQEKDMALVGKDVTIQSLRECVDKLEASAKTDAKVKEMFGALNTELLVADDVDPKTVFDVVRQSVVKFGSSQWFDIGTELGYNCSELEVITEGKARESSKLQTIIGHKLLELGNGRLIWALLAACKAIPHSIEGSVVEHANKLLKHHQDSIDV